MRKPGFFQTPKIYLKPEDFLSDVFAYFEWCDSHPLLEEMVSFHQGEVCRADKSKMRAYNKRGLASFLGITVAKLESYRKSKNLADAFDMAEQMIHTQKFEGAAAGLLNANIISRDLGLTDSVDLSSKDGSMTPTNGIDLSKLSTAALLEIAGLEESTDVT